MHQPLKIISLKICLVWLGTIALIPARGQICTGGFGDPVVNINFGRGTNPGPPLSANLPNLTYTANACPDDGFYTIARSVPGCFGNSWHSLASNHTPDDANGFMMVINASFNSGDFYVDTVKGLCGGTTYEFAAWVINLLHNPACSPGITPNLKFNIETAQGTVLGTYNTNNIPETPGPVWKQFGLTFTTPPLTQTVVLRITNIAPGGCGNDLAIDDITFRPCGPTAALNSPGLNSNTIVQCIDRIRPVTLQLAIGAGYNNPSTVWQQSLDGGATWSNTGVPGTSTSFVYTATNAGSVSFRVAVSEAGNIGIKECRILSNTFTVTTNDPGGGNAGITSPACVGDKVQLQAGNGSSFTWTGPNGFSSSEKDPAFLAAAGKAGIYYLQSSDASGCIARDTFLLEVHPKPNASTSPSVTVCENQAFKLGASGGSSYQWIPATGLSSAAVDSPVVTITTPMVYTVVVSNQQGCRDSATVAVNMLAAPKADAGPDKIIFEGQTTNLEGKVAGSNISWQWIPTSFMNNSQSLTPLIKPIDNITYRLQVTSNTGCGTAVDDVFIRVFKKVVVPNAFSPNGDGINDTWRIEALVTYPEATVEIFDRFGRNIFRSIGYQTPWDGTIKGKPVPVGAYYYLIDVNNNQPILKGSVMVIR